jgi:hypothetical protein
VISPEERSLEESCTPKSPRKVLQLRPGVKRDSQDPYEPVVLQPLYCLPFMRNDVLEDVITPGVS